MIKRFSSHFVYHLSLIAILFFGLVLSLTVASDKKSQMLVLTFTTFFYAGWGILHHAINHELTAKIMLEYILVGTLGMSIIFLFLKGGFGL